MDFSWFKIFTLLGTLFLMYACSNDLPEESVEDNTHAYELLSKNDESSNIIYYVKLHIIDFFVSVALGSEFGANVKVSKKWVQPMAIYLSGNPSIEFMTELDSIISEINQLASDDFSISQVQDSSASNFHIYAGTATDYARQHPTNLELLQSNNGLFSTYYDDHFHIFKGHMWVNTVDTNADEQKHLLREELTQSLGLAKDIPDYAHSIFYDRHSLTTEYSTLDKEVIRLLYHPRFISGLSEDSTRELLKDIMGIH